MRNSTQITAWLYNGIHINITTPFIFLMFISISKRVREKAVVAGWCGYLARGQLLIFTLHQIPSGKREFLKQLPDNLHRDRELEKGINYFVHVFAHNIVQSI